MIQDLQDKIDALRNVQPEDVKAFSLTDGHAELSAVQSPLEIPKLKFRDW